MPQLTKRKIGSAFFWNFLGSGGRQLIQFVFGCVLAHILIPKDFGLIAILSIFSMIANILQDSGFTSALIRKKEVSETEYSSVFYVNISISILIYVIFFFCAPLIGHYYEKPVLSNLSRFVFLAFVFDAFGVIQNVHVIRSMNFKITFYTTFIGGIASGIVAIIMAYYGYGAWSLAAQIVIQSFIRNVLLWVWIKWIPKLTFDRQCIRQMLPYSSKLLAASIMNQIFGNIHSMIIGKFSLNQAGLYSQSKKFSLLPQSIISDGIRVVAYPIMANISEGKDHEKKVFRKIIRLTSFVSFPVAMILITMASPIITIFLSHKWIDTVPMLRILAVGTAIYPLYCLLCTLLQKEGKSGRMFNLELIKNILIAVSIIIGIHWGVMGIVYGLSISLVIAFFIGIIVSCKFIHYSLFEFIKDMLPYIVISVVSYTPMFYFKFIDSIYIHFILQFSLGTILYLVLTYLLGSVVFKDIIETIRKQLIQKQE